MKNETMKNDATNEIPLQLEFIISVIFKRMCFASHLSTTDLKYKLRREKASSSSINYCLEFSWSRDISFHRLASI